MGMTHNSAWALSTNYQRGCRCDDCVEYMRVFSARWRAVNPERSRAYIAQWNAANPERIRAYAARWRKAHPERKQADVVLRRARQRNAAICDFTAAQWEELLEECGELCFYCGVAGVDLEMEHLTPLSRGGNHTYDNIVAACGPCNRRKATRTAQEFMQDDLQLAP